MESSSSVIASNEDLVVLILINVPATSLVRFKSVCKRWKFIISDNQFALNHCRKWGNNNNNNPPCGMFISHCCCRGTRWFKTLWQRLPIMSVPLFGNRVPCLSYSLLIEKIPEHLSTLKLMNIQSCNGLLLFAFLERDQLHCVVCNPTTSDFKVLPSTPPMLETDCKRCNLGGITLAFNNPSDDVQSQYHYKVVLVRRFCLRYLPPLELLIYSSETECWQVSGRTLDELIPQFVPIPIAGVFLNDTVYWLIERKHITCYNLNSDTNGRVQIPSQVGSMYGESDFYFRASCGRLCLARYTKVSRNEIFEIEVNDDEVKWFFYLRPVPDPDHLNSSLLGVVRKGDKHMVLLDAQTRIIVYNMLLHSAHELPPSISNSKGVFPNYSFEYIPSLAPL